LNKKTNDFNKPDPKIVLSLEQALGQTLTGTATGKEKKTTMAFSSYTVLPQGSSKTVDTVLGKI